MLSENPAVNAFFNVVKSSPIAPINDIALSIIALRSAGDEFRNAITPAPTTMSAIPPNALNKNFKTGNILLTTPPTLPANNFPIFPRNENIPPIFEKIPFPFLSSFVGLSGFLSSSAFLNLSAFSSGVS